MAIDDILTIKQSATDAIIDTMGATATYLPTDPLVSSFPIDVYLSKKTSTVPDGLESYVVTLYHTIKFRRHDLPTGYTPTRGDRIVIPGKPVYTIDNVDTNNRYLPKYAVAVYHTTTTSSSSTTSTTTTTSSSTSTTTCTTTSTPPP